MSAPVDVLQIVPIEDHPLSPEQIAAREEALSEWLPGSLKPHYEGPYLRKFGEGQALSWWCDGTWNMDSFFAGPSDIQDAPWRGFDRAAIARVGSQS